MNKNKNIPKSIKIYLIMYEYSTFAMRVSMNIMTTVYNLLSRAPLNFQML